MLKTCHLSPVPCSLFPVPCSLFPVPCSLFPVPCSPFPVPCSPFPLKQFHLGFVIVDLFLQLCYNGLILSAIIHQMFLHLIFP
ncbi:MAG: hypothetical protein ACK57T_18280 [Dolichospermum sp.]